MKFNSIHNYKHDITGKFNFINQVVADINESSLAEGRETETLLAIHNSILKMVETSKQTITEIESNKTTLYIIETTNQNSAPINVSNINLTYNFIDSHGCYYLVYDSNDGDLIHKISTLIDVLPIKHIALDDSIAPDAISTINTIKKYKGLK